ncbi:unnamed protein product [Miscanthus lutarioriparius]|uniref:VWFA domain-containing protein n=1 Tax=Miscanthus lutarioriparius TaxID=422564 RepID=A0A811PW51_9POAL|nr:unnamed protein product [Miscanthus lutarioriparius]
MSDTKGPHLPAAAPPPAGLYQDDEPLERSTAPAQGPAANGGLVLSTQCEFPALARAASRDRFAVLVHAKAPLDLVTVLDVSGSMKGEKLALLKQAMCFVIDQLGPADRLSVVTFSNGASRLTRLARMSDAGKAWAKFAVESLAAQGGTNIRQGLRVGAEVLTGRREKNVVAGMILLSDGHDTCGWTIVRPDGTKSYTKLVPPSFTSAGHSSRPAPIHTFGFGTNHDAAAMHDIAEATGGTFSFVGNQAAIQDSFARCVGGLLSVAVQEARVAVTCLHRGVHIQEVKSGAYVSHVGTEDGRAATIDVGELYDGEERRFLVLVYVPRARSTEEVTRLVKASCTYREAATGQARQVAAPAAVVQRPLDLATLPAPSLDVERERVRLAAAEDIATALVAADGGQNAGAARILESRLKAVERSAPGATGDDPTCEAIKEELRDLSARVGDRAEYQQTGRACLLAGMSSHAQQRASGTDVQSSSSKRSSAYLTPKMEEMVEISRESSRKRGGGSQQPVGTGTSGQVKQAKIEEV